MGTHIKTTKKHRSSNDRSPHKPGGMAPHSGAQTRLAVNLPNGTHRQLKARAAEGGSSIRDYILDLLRRNGIE